MKTPSNAMTPSRRAVLQKASALGAAAVTGSLWAGRAHAQTGGAPETRAAKLVFIALTDAAPLFVADEKGLATRKRAANGRDQRS